MLDTSADTGWELLALAASLSITFCLIPNSPDKVPSVFVNLAYCWTWISDISQDEKPAYNTFKTN